MTQVFSCKLGCSKYKALSQIYQSTVAIWKRFVLPEAEIQIRVVRKGDFCCKDIEVSHEIEERVESSNSTKCEEELGLRIARTGTWMSSSLSGSYFFISLPIKFTLQSGQASPCSPRQDYRLLAKLQTPGFHHQKDSYSQPR